MNTDHSLNFMYSMLYYYAGYIRFIIDHRHIEWTADGNGGDRDTRGVRGR